MTIGVLALWSAEGTRVFESRTAVLSRRPRGRLEVLTEDTLTADEARALDERLQNPPLLPSRPARRVQVGDGQFLFQRA